MIIMTNITMIMSKFSKMISLYFLKVIKNNIYNMWTLKLSTIIYKNYHCDLLAFVFMPDKRILFLANTSQQNYFTFTKDIIVDNMELDSLESALNKLHSKPVLNPVLK